MMAARYRVTKLGSNEGFAMMATLGVLTLLSVLVISVFTNAMSSFRSGMTDLDKSRTYYAAEAAAESGMAQLAVSLQDAVIEDYELSAIAPPDIEGFTFDSFSVTRIGAVETEPITDGPFAGLYSRTQVVEIRSVAVAPNHTSSGVLVTAKAQAIPIFQFGVFFDKDLEISNLPDMTFNGWIHSNGSIWTCSANAWYEDLITTPNKYYMDYKFRHCGYSGVYINDAAGDPVNVTFDSRDTPDSNDFRAASDAAYDARLKTDAHGVDSLRIPLPDGVDPIEVIQPRDGADGTLEQNAKYAWKADWYIEVDLANVDGNSGSGGATPFSVVMTHLQALIDANTPGPVADALADALAKINAALDEINVPDASAAISELDDAKDDVQAAPGPPSGLSAGELGALISEINQIKADINGGGDGQAGSGSPLCDSGITHTRPGGEGVPTVAECSDFFSFSYEKFYEGRELRWADVLDIDVDKLYDWLDAQGESTEIIYITMDTIGAQDPDGDGVFPVIRLINADKLGAPITWATNHPLYVWGDYNSDIMWQPATLVGDAVTFLSVNWDDDEHQTTSVDRRDWDAGDTEVYAAILAGHSLTPCDHEDTGCGNQPYGGGLENFPRFLEWWNGVEFLYSGSLVSLFYNTQGDEPWSFSANQNANNEYYWPPIRNWSFDTRFEDPENLPPGTPVVGNVIHTAFRPLY